MSGSWIDRSATSYDTATAATSGAALASLGNDSHLGPRPACRGAGHRDRRRLVDEVHHEGSGGAAVPVQVGQIAVEDQRAVVDHDHPATERLDVLEVVGGEQQRGAALGVERRRNSRSRPLLTTSRPIVGSSR